MDPLSVEKFNACMVGGGFQNKHEGVKCVILHCFAVEANSNADGLSITAVVRARYARPSQQQ